MLSQPVGHEDIFVVLHFIANDVIEDASGGSPVHRRRNFHDRYATS